MSIGKNPPIDDWRRQGQEKYLFGIRLFFRKFKPYRDGWDYDHCEFCSSKFSLEDGDLKIGYSSDDSYRWICEDCFRDFKDEFEWQVENDRQ